MWKNWEHMQKLHFKLPPFNLQISENVDSSSTAVFAFDMS